MSAKKKKATDKPGTTSTVAVNRRARFDYEIIDTFAAGMVLTGSEIKSVREGRLDLQGSYARLKRREVWIEGMNIAPYASAGYMPHDPRRDRKLLLHRRQINKIGELMDQKGLTLVPMRIFFQRGNAKLEIGVGRGKRQYDKRQKIREREEGRQASRAIRQSV